MSGLVSSSCDMPMARLSPRLFMIKGMLVPLPEPGAPLSHTTSRGHTRRCETGWEGAHTSKGAVGAGPAGPARAE